uniref:BTB domain-containing protein n=1 Tax=Panagrolaimus sp. ES5 TaxID=591445 RepID=A0AC34FXT4_9BILA
MASQQRPSIEESEKEEDVIKVPRRSTATLQPPTIKIRGRLPSASKISTASPTPKQATASTQSIASVTANQSPSLQHSKLYESLTDKKYHDVILAASDGTKITSLRCILAKYSTHFAKLIELSKEIPVKISIQNFNAETIQGAVDFMFSKRDAIVRKQFSLFKFAAAYKRRF